MGDKSLLPPCNNYHTQAAAKWHLGSARDCESSFENEIITTCHLRPECIAYWTCRNKWNFHQNKKYFFQGKAFGNVVEASPWYPGVEFNHYIDVIMTTIASQITSLKIVHSTVYPGADQSQHQSSASLAFVWGIHRRPVNSPHKWPVMWKMFPFDDVIMESIGSMTIWSSIKTWCLEQPSNQQPFYQCCDGVGLSMQGGWQGWCMEHIDQGNTNNNVGQYQEGITEFCGEIVLPERSLTHDRNPYIILFLIGYIWSLKHTNLLKTIIDRSFCCCHQGRSFLT